MKICVIGCATYYNKGMSYERAQLAASLIDLGHDVLFASVTIHQQWTDEAYEMVYRFAPQLIILVPHVNEVNPANLRGIGCPIVLLMADDDWRRPFGLEMSAHCDYVLGNAPDSVQAYGSKSIPFEWAIYPPLFAGDPVERCYDIGFIGQMYGNRRDYIQALQDAGLSVLSSGFISPDEMARLLRQCKIGLNLSKTSEGGKRQIKIRPFEIAAAGAMILTEYAPGIENSFFDGKEAVFFETPREMVEAALYYLSRDVARIGIAAAGHARVLCEHTLAHRWQVIFKAVGV